MERDFLAELLASRGQEPQRRRRGGLAGIWDRNKGAIGSVAGAALGNLLMPGAGGAIAGKLLGGAAGGALARGRFDAGQALGDALTGSGAMEIGGMARRGLSNVLGRGAAQAASAAPSAVGGETQRVLAQMGQGAQPGAMASAQAQMPPARGLGRIVGGAGQAAGAGGGRGLSRVLEFIRENPKATEMGLQAISGIMGSQAERRLREEEQREERRRAQNMAMLVAPMYNPMGGR